MQKGLILLHLVLFLDLTKFLWANLDAFALGVAAKNLILRISWNNLMHTAKNGPEHTT